MNLIVHMDLIAEDLTEFYGIDLFDAEISERRPWTWLQERVIGLLNRPPNLTVLETAKGVRLVPVHTTRIGYALAPPTSYIPSD